MNDNQLLYLSTFLCIAFTLYYTVRHGKRTGTAMAGILAGYSLPLYYLFFFRSGGGSSLVWWFYLITLNSLFIAASIVRLAVKTIRRKKPRRAPETGESLP
ncbi:conjugal transfer protein [Prevotella dentasini]|uniref:conjugal transfer protein n=1 Tax=Prevotella dentasini TaxID=589537 RepID=UPI000B1B696F|nr:conjugal transfer protein [Prevotella dentasini]